MLDRFDRHGSTDLVQPRVVKEVDKIAIVRLGWMSPSRFPCQWCPSPGPEAASSVTQTSTGSRFCLCWSWLKTIQCVCPQGLNFYTQVKTVTSMWREGDAGSSRSALSMPVLWNHFAEMYFCEEKILAIFVKNAITLASENIQVSVSSLLSALKVNSWNKKNASNFSEIMNMNGGITRDKNRGLAGIGIGRCCLAVTSN